MTDKYARRDATRRQGESLSLRRGSLDSPSSSSEDEGSVAESPVLPNTATTPTMGTAGSSVGASSYHLPSFSHNPLSALQAAAAAAAANLALSSSSSSKGQSAGYYFLQTPGGSPSFCGSSAPLGGSSSSINHYSQQQLFSMPHSRVAEKRFAFLLVDVHFCGPRR